MAGASALNRAVVAMASGSTITGIQAQLEASPVVPAGTFASLTGGIQDQSFWFAGLSYVQSGNTIPSLATSPNDNQFLWEAQLDPPRWKTVINTAGSPTYQSSAIFLANPEFRTQQRCGPGGSVYFHLYNGQAGTITVTWLVQVRVLWGLT